jgi:hypothetical protein
MGDAYMDVGGRVTQDAKTEGRGEGEIEALKRVIWPDSPK